MAGAMRKVGEYLGLVEQADGFDEDLDEHPDAAEVGGGRNEPQPRPVRAVPDESDPKEVAHLDERRRSNPKTPTPLSRITTLHPTTYNEARMLGEQFREGIPVIMNLSEMDDKDAKRLVDFAAGLVFAVHGTIERVTNKVFLLSPPNVSVAAEDKRRIAEDGFFNQS